jgi:hypothetical protein
MVQVHEVKAQELEGALDVVVVAAGWVAVDSGQGENVFAPIVVLRLPISRVLPVMRFSVPNVGHQ